MPNDILQICQEVLKKFYFEKLGIEFGNSIDEVEQGRQPIWLYVSGYDLISESQLTSADVAGLLLDPEIGLLSYVLPFQVETDIRKQIKRALALRSKLSIVRDYSASNTERNDTRGAWRIVMHWVVEERDMSRWTQQVMELRRETAFSEELSFDAIFLNGGDIKRQIEQHGFPRLLLTTREVLKKGQLDEMTHWLSANDIVAQTMAGFVSHFQKPEQCDLAQDVVRSMQEFCKKENNKDESLQVPENPQTVSRIHVRDFRNLRDVQFDFGIQPVGACIVHGPNGTGKSSLCEAISVALFQSSYRYKCFADREQEKDITARDRAREYLHQYLTPVDAPTALPLIALNDRPLTRPQLVDSDATEEADLAMCGTILTQDTSLEFSRMSSHELGARVLRGYSDLADHIEEYVDARVNQANTERQNFLRGLGISAAITKPDTAYERIVKKGFDQSLPPFPHAFVEWLDVVCNIMGGMNSDLPQRWRTWGDETCRNELARDIARLNKNEESIRYKLYECLACYNELALRSAEIIKMVENRIAPIRQSLENAVENIRLWGEWLERRTVTSEGSTSPEIDTLTEKLSALQTQQKELLERGRNAGEHVDHLTRVEAFVRDNWSKQHPYECPTCGTNHADHRGILGVIELLRKNTTSDRDRLRTEYVVIKTQIENIKSQLSELGQVQCPVGADEQVNLIESLQWLIPGTESFSDWIGNNTQRVSLSAIINALRRIPSVPAIIDAESEAEQLAHRLIMQFYEADNIFEAPTNWKPVKDKLTKSLAEIVKEHLPNTLAKLWCELSLNLTSAPWLLAERPFIDVVSRRGEQRSTVRVKDRLARYILNQAEIHTLGLAWFLTRYLTRGRFFHACLVMDDPAHEQDQTSFRDLCRLWETMMRLHRVYSRPLKIVVLLNQESRAIEAARATSGVLAVLGWERDQKNAVKSISFTDEGVYAPQPISYFEKTGTQS